MISLLISARIGCFRLVLQLNQIKWKAEKREARNNSRKKNVNSVSASSLRECLLVFCFVYRKPIEHFMRPFTLYFCDWTRSPGSWMHLRKQNCCCTINFYFIKFQLSFRLSKLHRRDDPQMNKKIFPWQFHNSTCQFSNKETCDRKTCWYENKIVKMTRQRHLPSDVLKKDKGLEEAPLW